MRHRRNAVKLTLACVALALLAVNAAPLLSVVFLGLEHIGRLENALPPAPTPLAWDGSPLDQIEWLLPPHLTDPLSLTPADQPGAEIVGDATTPGVSAYLLTLDEDSLNDLLRRRFLSDGASNDRFRDLWVDLQPGGLILYADVDLGLYWQQMGLLLLQNDLALIPAGLVLDERLYALPDEGFVAPAISSVRSISERILENLMIVGPLPGEAHVSQARFHADRLQILAQAAYPISPPPDTGWQLLEPGVELRQSDVAVGNRIGVDQAGDPTQEPQDHRFGQELANEGPAPGSYCQTDGNLLLPVSGSGQQKARQVGAGDEED